MANEFSTDEPTLESLQAQLEEKQELIQSMQRRSEIEDLLRQHHAIDLDAARLLTEMAVAEQPESDYQAAVEDLIRRKPMLFRPPVRAPSSQAPKPVPNPHAAVTQAAAEARQSGRRGDLLHYLRLKRKRQ